MPPDMPPNAPDFNGQIKTAMDIVQQKTQAFAWVRGLLRTGMDVKMARLEGFEPPTNGFGSHYSIRLSYRRVL